MNLAETPSFVLPEEGGRPVYVPADSIVPGTGALGSSAARVHQEFGQVLVTRSDLKSDTKQVTLRLLGATRRGASFVAAYTFTRARDQSSYSCCSVTKGFAAPTTAGDPNAVAWSTSDLERRHSLLLTGTYPVSGALEVGVIGRLTSGIPFTQYGGI